METLEKAPSVTIADIARETGVSKSTVSRVLNCKGRIGAGTRKKVMEKASEMNYLAFSGMRNNIFAKSCNVAVVVPKDADSGDLTFFQNCLFDLSESIVRRGYDVLLVVISQNDITPLEKVVLKHKVDGVILTRIESDDAAVAFLKKENFPFVVFGTSEEDGICQIDSDQTSGCFEMTKFMISQGCRNVAVLGGNKRYLVNRWRFEGFRKAVVSAGLRVEDSYVCWDLDNLKILSDVLPELMKKNPQCLVCMDDAVCVYTLKWLKQNDYEVPQDIQVISFYDNQVLENNSPPVTALYVNVRNLAFRAGNIMIDKIEGKTVPERTEVNYELRIRESFR